MSAPRQPEQEHRTGANVTAAAQAFTGQVVDVHRSMRIRRDDVELLVGDTELRDGDEVLEHHLSYLVERNWDGAPVWMTPDQLQAGHLTTREHVRKAGL